MRINNNKDKEKIKITIKTKTKMPEGVVVGDEFAGAAKIYCYPGVAPLLAPQPLLAVRDRPCNISIYV